MRSLIFFVMVGRAAALRLTTYNHNEDLGKDYEESLFVFDTVVVHDPEPTIYADINGNWSKDGVLTQMLGSSGPTPVTLNIAPVVMMTGTDRLSAGIQQSHGFESFWCQHIIDEWRKNGEKGGFVDVGANMGAFTLPLAHALTAGNHTNAAIVAVEGLPLNRKLLRYSIKENGMINVHLYEYAVLDHEAADDTQMRSGGPNSGHAGVARNGRIEVPVTTLDAIWKREGALMRNVFAMKMDIEGSEARALHGGGKWLNAHGPCMIVIELNHGEGNLPSVEQLRAHGYERKPLGRWFARNKVFVKKDFQACVSNLQ